MNLFEDVYETCLAALTNKIISRDCREMLKFS